MWCVAFSDDQKVIRPKNSRRVHEPTGRLDHYPGVGADVVRYGVHDPLQHFQVADYRKTHKQYDRFLFSFCLSNYKGN